MANPNVIESTKFGKYPTPSTNSYHFVREPESDYSSDELTAKIAALLKMPAWPQLPDGAYLNEQQAKRFYRAAQGIQGLVHILNRSTHLRGMAQDYESEANHSLSEFQESQLWAALIETGNGLANLIDDLHSRSLETSRQ